MTKFKNIDDIPAEWDYRVIEVIQYLVQLQYKCYDRNSIPIKNYEDREKIYSMFADLITEIAKHKDL